MADQQQKSGPDTAALLLQRPHPTDVERQQHLLLEQSKVLLLFLSYFSLTISEWDAKLLNSSSHHLF